MLPLLLATAALPSCHPAALCKLCRALAAERMAKATVPTVTWPPSPSLLVLRLLAEAAPMRAAMRASTCGSQCGRSGKARLPPPKKRGLRSQALARPFRRAVPFLPACAPVHHRGRHRV